MVLDPLSGGRLLGSILENLDIEELTALVDTPAEQLVSDIGASFPSTIRSIVLNYYNNRQAMAAPILKAKLALGGFARSERQRICDTGH